MKRRNLCGKRVKLARVEREMKQVDLVAALSVDLGINIPPNAVSLIETGHRPVSDIELVAFSKFFDVSVDWLLFGDKTRSK